jgi:hypothetical protein
MIQLDRDDPDEQFLVRMLTHSEPDLEVDYRDKPMAFAVFGRGRTLWGLVGEGINSDVIEDACAYLTGMCSCQIKAQNPGFDLLLHVDWEKMFEQQAEDAADGLVSVVGARLPGVIEAPADDAAGAADEVPMSTGPSADEVEAQNAAPESDAAAGDATAAEPVPANSMLARNLLVAVGGGAIVLIMLSWFVRRPGGV